MSRRRILVVDDDPDIVEMVQFFLSGSNFQVFVAQNGKEALEQVEMNRPDLVLLDIRMPQMDGLEVCERLRNGVMTKSTPIIMVTAEGRRQDVADALAAGADGYVIKPFNLKKLVERIQNSLTVKGLHKD